MKAELIELMQYLSASVPLTAEEEREVITDAGWTPEEYGAACSDFHDRLYGVGKYAPQAPEAS
jgi:hypothetical protein